MKGMEDPFEPLILDCDFCENVEHFQDRGKAVDQGYDWMEATYEDGTVLKTVSCGECSTEKVSPSHEEKRETLTYSENAEKPSKKAKTDPNQNKLSEIQ